MLGIKGFPNPVLLHALASAYVYTSSKWATLEFGSRKRDLTLALAKLSNPASYWMLSIYSTGHFSGHDSVPYNLMVGMSALSEGTYLGIAAGLFPRVANGSHGASPLRLRAACYLQGQSTRAFVQTSFP